MSETQKIEKPGRRNTGKLFAAVSDLVGKGKESAILRILTIVLASGAGEKVAEGFQWTDAKWWMIAAGLGTWWLASELRKIRDELQAGGQRFDNHGKRIETLEGFKTAHELTHQKPRRKSQGNLPVLTPEIA